MTTATVPHVGQHLQGCVTCYAYVINDYSGLIRTDAGNVYANGDFAIKRFAEDAPTAACYHPRSCARCDRAGACCGRHYVGNAGHERCTGMHA